MTTKLKHQFSCSALTFGACVLLLFALSAHSMKAKSVAVQSGPGTIAFITDRDGNSEIYSMDQNGGSQTNLTHSAVNEKTFVWSPDGGKIAFLRKNAANTGDDSNLYVINADGSGLTKVTNDNFQYQNSSNLTWAPNGTKLAYVSGSDLAHYLSVVNIDGSNKQHLTEVNGPYLDIAWSPDGNKIAFSLGADFNSANLWVMNADGTGLTRFTNHEEPGIYSRSPSWSPDSMRVVFESNRDGNDEIYMMWIRSFYSDQWLNLTRLTNNPAADVDPAWSPDGQLIAFSTNRDGNFEVYTMRWDTGANLTRLTTSAAADGNPRWRYPNASPFVSEDTIQFSRGSYRTFEDPAANGAQLEIVITRLGARNTTAIATYQTIDGTASGRSDYTPVQGRIDFAVGQASASFVIPVTYDSFNEGSEIVELHITFAGGSPSVTFGNQRLAQLTIADSNLNIPPANAIDLSDNFVRQHYHDFLGREPDPSGLQFWTNQITQCGADAACVRRKREDVSGAFFNSIEFNQTGFFVYRLNIASYGTFPHFESFMIDKGFVAEGVVVGQTGWQARLEDNKNRFVRDWMLSSSFINLCGGTRSNSEYVDILLRNTAIPATPEYRNSLIADLDAGRKTQADVLKEIVDNSDFKRAELNRAFVLMQYFGYLRRNPNDFPDTDFSGYDFWLRKLNEFNGDFRGAQMVKAFITSSEYRHRFGQ